MWSPTHVQVLVKRAKGLNLKGKNGTNDAFVTIALGKEKFQTSVKEKSIDPVDWSEQCELSIPSHGNTADIQLTVLHRNFLGVDEFLGQVSLPLRDFDVYERPKSKTFPLKCKPGKNKNDYRGEIEVKVGFTVKASTNIGGSIADLSKKNKGSIVSLQKISGSISGSLMSLGKKERKSIKKLVKSIGHKGDREHETARNVPLKASRQLSAPLEEFECNEDPGVNSDDDFDECPDDVEEVPDDDEVLGLDDVPVSTVPDPEPAPASRHRRLTSSERSSSRRVSEGKLPPLNEDEAADIIIREGPIPDCVAKEPNEDRLKGSQSSLPSYNEATSGIFSQGQGDKTSSRPGNKKKIIPVQSDFESSSPSPEPPPAPSPPPAPKLSMRVSQSSVNLARAQQDTAENQDRSKKPLGMKLKTSYSFRDHADLVSRVTPPRAEATTPPVTRPSLPHDVLARYNGKTREDLIEMVVSLQNTVDTQGKKVIDLEDYIDNLLIKILDVAPILLKQDSPITNKHSIA